VLKQCRPRAVNVIGVLQSREDWRIQQTPKFLFSVAEPLLTSVLAPEHQQFESEEARSTTVEEQILELRSATPVYTSNFAVYHSQWIAIA
jgi:hypothetical protein